MISYNHQKKWMFNWFCKKSPTSIGGGWIAEISWQINWFMLKYYQRRWNILKKMSEYAYHYGLMVRIYPNTEQKQIIFVNSAVSSFVYNKMIQNIVRRMWELIEFNEYIQEERWILHPKICNRTNASILKTIQKDMVSFRYGVEQLCKNVTERPWSNLYT